MKSVIILGSARRDGDAMNLAILLKSLTDWDVIDLNDYNIMPYDYDHDNRTDDYLPLMNKVIKEYTTIVFVTPVYWYSMSGTLKIFFDRFSDLLTIEKELGRKLRGKNMAVITTSIGNNLGNDFWIPFKKTSDYLGMNFIDGFHTIVGEYELSLLHSFVKNIVEE